MMHNTITTETENEVLLIELFGETQDAQLESLFTVSPQRDPLEFVKRC